MDVAAANRRRSQMTRGPSVILSPSSSVPVAVSLSPTAAEANDGLVVVKLTQLDESTANLCAVFAHKSNLELILSVYFQNFTMGYCCSASGAHIGMDKTLFKHMVNELEPEMYTTAMQDPHPELLRREKSKFLGLFTWPLPDREETNLWYYAKDELNNLEREIPVARALFDRDISELVPFVRDRALTAKIGRFQSLEKVDNTFFDVWMGLRKEIAQLFPVAETVNQKVFDGTLMSTASKQKLAEIGAQIAQRNMDPAAAAPAIVPIPVSRPSSSTPSDNEECKEVLDEDEEKDSLNGTTYIMEDYKLTLLDDEVMATEIINISTVKVSWKKLSYEYKELVLCCDDMKKLVNSIVAVKKKIQAETDPPKKVGNWKTSSGKNFNMQFQKEYNDLLKQLKPLLGVMDQHAKKVWKIPQELQDMHSQAVHLLIEYRKDYENVNKLLRLARGAAKVQAMCESKAKENETIQ